MIYILVCNLYFCIRSSNYEYQTELWFWQLWQIYFFLVQVLQEISPKKQNISRIFSGPWPQNILRYVVPNFLALYPIQKLWIKTVALLILLGITLCSSNTKTLEISITRKRRLLTNFNGILKQNNRTVYYLVPKIFVSYLTSV